MDGDINTLQLIQAIKSRPAIWDNTAAAYKDKTFKSEAWEEVCAELSSDYETMSDMQKERMGTIALKKWTHMRDTWMRNMKKYHHLRAQDKKCNIRKYVYHNQMSFLKKMFYTRCNPIPVLLDSMIEDSETPTSSSLLHTPNEAEEADPVNPKPKQRKQPKRPFSAVARRNRRTNDSVPKIEIVTKNTLPNEGKINANKKSSHVRKVETENRHMLFFKSILPSVSAFTDEETLEFQASILSILQALKKRPPAGCEATTDGSDAAADARSSSGSEDNPPFDRNPLSPLSTTSAQSNHDYDDILIKTETIKYK